MNENIHVAIFHRNDGMVWLEVSPTAGQQPVLRRSLNLWNIVETEDSLADIYKKIRALCATWYDRHANLPLYCERAKKWTGCTSSGTEVRLSLINRAGAAWEYFRKKERQRNSLRFNECIMCIDWVCAEGLTEDAQELIITSVSRDVEKYEAANRPDRVRKQSLVTRFMTTLPPHEDIAKDVATAFYPRLSPSQPIRGLICVP